MIDYYYRSYHIVFTPHHLGYEFLVRQSVLRLCRTESGEAAIIS